MGASFQGFVNFVLGWVTADGLSLFLVTKPPLLVLMQGSIKKPLTIPQTHQEGGPRHIFSFCIILELWGNFRQNHMIARIRVLD